MLERLRSWRKQAADFFVRHFLYSFRSTVLSFYTPIIVFFILLTGTLSYNLAMYQIEKSAYSDIENVVFQTTIYMDNRFEGVVEQMTALANDPDILHIINTQPEDVRPEDYLKIQSHVDTVRLFNSTIVDSVYLNFNDGKFVFFRGDYDYRMIGFTYEKYRRMYQNGPDDVYWQNFLPQYVHQEASDKEPEHVIDVFRLIGRQGAKRNGIILFRLRYGFFEKVFGRSLVNDSGYLMLVSPEGASTFKYITPELKMDVDAIEQLRTTTIKEGRLSFVNAKGEKLIAIYDTLPTNKWKLAAVFRESALLDKIQYIKYATVGIIIVLMAIAVLLTNWLVRYITRPISGLVERMRGMRGKEISTVAEPMENEVEILDRGVADLMGHIRELMGQVAKDQETRRQLELSVIQMQIHPHFLYNTLFAIKGLCDMGMGKEASEMITALADFFRVGLSCGHEIICVEDEVSHARNYLFIQEMRYGDQFSYEIEIEPDILHCSIIKLTLQPLVENAIYHGVKEKRGKGIIKVKGWQQRGLLYFAVEDNGLGMTKERLSALRRGLAETRRTDAVVGFGVYSVFERLRLHYGMEAGLEIESEWGKGTRVLVVLPIRHMEGDEVV